MPRRLIAILLLSSAVTLAGAVPVDAKQFPLPHLKIYDAAAPSTLKRGHSLFGKFDVGGASVALAELTGDAQREIVLAEGLGKEPRVKVLSWDGTVLSSFLAYNKNFTRGVTVAAGDLNNDDSRDIVTGTGFGGGPHVRMWNRYGNELFTPGGFFAYDAAFRGGVNVATADVDGDGSEEIVTGPGFGGVPQVRVFRTDGSVLQEFLAFDPDMTQGVSVVGGDFDGDGRDDLAVARQGAGTADIRVFRFSRTGPQFAMSFNGAPADYVSGLELTAGDVDGDGREEIIAAENGGRTVRAYTIGGLLIRSWVPYAAAESDAVRAAVGDVDGDGRADLVTSPFPRLVSAPQAITVASDGVVGSSKRIEVNLARQQLWAWENGRLAHTFLISSGTRRFPSPSGAHAVFRKVPKMDYRWSYGPNNPNNYYLPNVVFNLNFKPRYYIHYAYWHNNFGVPMSHGCINTSLADARWIYEWTDVGTPVEVR